MERFNKFISEDYGWRPLLVEAKLKAEDYVAAIVIGWHKIHNIKLNPSSVGISPKVIKLLRWMMICSTLLIQ